MKRLRSAIVLLLLACVAPVWAQGIGQDDFDQIRSVPELRTLQEQITQTAARVRPAVVQLRLWGARGGSTGTGVVITSDGLIATCGHVGVRSGQRVEATLADGTVLRGRTLGQANEGVLDCGLVQLDTQGRTLETAPLGTSQGLAQGDWLLAMGYTQGPPDEPRPALLRVGRVLRSDDVELLFDAPIDAGDSGGPSFNLRGEVVALNSRCGRQPWENAATPIDRLRERIGDLRDGLDEHLFRLGKPDSENMVRTLFASGASPDARLAVQRSAPLGQVTAVAARSLLRVTDGAETLAYATVVDDSGLLVTKLSQLSEQRLGGEVTVETRDGERRIAELVGRDPRTDLALLAVGGGGLTAIEWAPSTEIRPGEVLLSPRLGPNGPALGFAAIERRESDRDWESVPYLGVRSEPLTAEEARALGVKSALRVDEVVADTAADRAGFQVGDVLVAIDGAPLGGRLALRRVIAQHEVGDIVRFKVLRAEEATTLEATLARRTPRERPVRRGNTTTPISKVSAGFGEVIAHDGNLWPDQCGGPLVDIDGHAVGINIARFDRTATHALAAERVRDSVQMMRRAREVSVPTVPAAGRSLPSEAAP